MSISQKASPKVPILRKEGERIRVPEGGELVCCKNAENGQLFLKIEYSRDTMIRLSMGLFAYQRPSNFRRMIMETPELLTSPKLGPCGIPAIESRLEENVEKVCSVNGRNSSISIDSSRPRRGPITPVNPEVAALHRNHLMGKKILSNDIPLSPSGFPLISTSSSVSPPAFLRPLRNPSFS